ncbi:Hypothetical_protein [Hexamita inflata]|uniref:Hypothetical_protein n=1 Tax=Hexamita inflata TaxID=28002 RepID=A0AA86PD96_9EUKA|nr:Hypothetical protein HINF_LOCUS24486 [Hexamita inflata]
MIQVLVLGDNKIANLLKHYNIVHSHINNVITRPSTQITPPKSITHLCILLQEPDTFATRPISYISTQLNRIGVEYTAQISSQMRHLMDIGNYLHMYFRKRIDRMQYCTSLVQMELNERLRTGGNVVLCGLLELGYNRF